MLIKVKGLVIKAANVGENDKYLTVLTEEYGKIMFRASSVRNFKNKHLTVTQLFSYSEFTLLKMPTFTRMNEAQLIENFYNIRLNLQSLALATYIADVASIMCVEGRDEDGILSLILNTLYVISREKMPNQIIKGVFEMRILSKTGFMPNFESCEICQTYDLSKIFFFNIIGGNLICEDCLDKIINANVNQQLIKISRDVLQAVKFVAFTENERLYSFALHEDMADEFANLCERYLLAQVSANISSLKFYKECAN